MKKFDQVFPPPPFDQFDSTPVNVPNTSSVVIIAFTMVTMVMGYMLYREKGAWTAVVLGLPFFVITTSLYLLVVTQTISRGFADWQRECTKRRYIEAMERVNSSVREASVAVKQIEHTDTFVPALPVGAREGALSWLARLYGADNELSPRHVLLETNKAEYRGMIRSRMCGEDERGWLISRGVLREVQGGYCIDVNRFYYKQSLVDL